MKRRELLSHLEMHGCYCARDTVRIQGQFPFGQVSLGPMLQMKLLKLRGNDGCLGFVTRLVLGQSDAMQCKSN